MEIFDNRNSLNVNIFTCNMYPNAPKRSLNAFYWFCTDERNKVKALNPEYGVGDIAKELGRKWADVEAEVKQKYELMAEKDKARYEREMTEYKTSGKIAMSAPSMQAQQQAAEKAALLAVAAQQQAAQQAAQHHEDHVNIFTCDMYPNAPKRSLNAFYWFCTDERNKVKALNPEYGVGDIAKELGRKWADVEAEVKQKYELMAEKDKARYEREMTEYKTSGKIAMSAPSMQAQQQAAQKAALLAVAAQQQAAQQAAQHHEDHDDEDGEGDDDENQ